MTVPVAVPSRLYLDGTPIPLSDYGPESVRVTTGHREPLILHVRVPAARVAVQPHLAKNPACRHVEIDGVSCLTLPVRDWQVEVENVDGQIVPSVIEVGVYVGALHVVRAGDELDPARDTGKPVAA